MDLLFKKVTARKFFSGCWCILKISMAFKALTKNAKYTKDEL